MAKSTAEAVCPKTCKQDETTPASTTLEAAAGHTVTRLSWSKHLGTTPHVLKLP